MLTSLSSDVDSARYDGTLHPLGQSGDIFVGEDHTWAAIAKLDEDPTRTTLQIQDGEGEVVTLPRPGRITLLRLVDGELLFADDRGVSLAAAADDWTPHYLTNGPSDPGYSASNVPVWQTQDGAFHWHSDGELYTWDEPGVEAVIPGEGAVLLQLESTWRVGDPSTQSSQPLPVPRTRQSVKFTNGHFLFFDSFFGLISCDVQGQCLTLDSEVDPFEIAALPDGRVGYLSDGVLMVTDGVTTEELFGASRTRLLARRQGPEGPLFLAIDSGSATPEITLVSPDGSWVRELGSIDGQQLDFVDGCLVAATGGEIQVRSLGLPGRCGEHPDGEELFSFRPDAPVSSLAAHPEATNEFLVVEGRIGEEKSVLKRVTFDGRVDVLTSGDALMIGRPFSPGLGFR